MITLLQLIIVFFLNPFFGEEVHDFHLSKAMVKHSETEQSIQVSMNIYIDDLEYTLGGLGFDSLFLCTKFEKPQADSIIANYIKNQFSVSSSGKKLQFDYLGKEISEGLDAVWIYMEAMDIEKPIELTLSNTILMESFSDQKNIMNVNVGGREKHIILSIDNPSKTLSWK